MYNHKSFLVSARKWASHQFYAVVNSTPVYLSIPQNQRASGLIHNGLPRGVYSVFRTFEHNKFLGLDMHLARSKHSLALLEWDTKIDSNLLCQVLHKVCTNAPWKNTRVRYDIFEEPKNLYGVNSRILISLEPFTEIPQDLYKNGVKSFLAIN